MNIPQLRVFKKGYEKVLINFLMDRGFSPFFDSVNDKIDWSGQHRYYTVTDDMKFVESEKGDLLIAFMYESDVDAGVWPDILKWLNFEKGDAYDRADALLDRDLKNDPLPSLSKDMHTDPVKPMEPEPYDFYWQELENGRLYEITKPHTDRCYTVWEPCSLPPDFRSHRNLFSSLFVCESWGVAAADHSFLKLVWGQLKMDGVCDLEALVKERVINVEAGAPEPIVYRASFNEVAQTLHENGIRNGKRKVVESDAPVKKLTK